MPEVGAVLLAKATIIGMRNSRSKALVVDRGFHERGPYYSAAAIFEGCHTARA
jgi:hypothetical protein